MLGFRLPFARRKGYGMGATGGTGAVMTSSLLTSLISYWKLDETSGTRYDSVTASANDLTDNNTVTQAAGVKGTDYAAQFTAANSESLTKASNASLQTGDIDFTLAGWVYLDSLGTWRVMAGKRQNATNREFFIEVVPSNVLNFQVSADGINFVSQASTTPTIVASTWYFVAAWHDSVANTINIQVNNGTVYSKSHTTGVYVGTSQFAMGVGESGSNYWNGRVDEVGFWKRVLTATERTNLYNAGAGVTYPFTGVP